MANSNGNKQWSPQQEAIFSWFRSGKGNLVVRARAGTGKTTTILTAIDYAPEAKILLAAFNKRIADELKLKLRNPKAKAQTLHGAGFGVIARNWRLPQNALDDDRGFNLAMETIDGDPDSGFDKKLARLISRLASMGKNAAPFADVARLQELALEYDIVPEDTQEDRGFNLERVAECALEAMKLAAQANAHGPASIDFDDMVFVPLYNNWVKGTYDVTVIDEAQDMNFSQLLLAQRITKKGGRIVVVGDDRQAIYRFRGADSESIDRLKTELQAEEMGLTITSRCPRSVVAAAAALVPDYQAAPEAPEGLIRDITEEKLCAEVQPNDFVLSRKNAPLVRFCLATLRAGKRARIEGRDIGASIIAVVKKLAPQSMEDLEKQLVTWEMRETKRLIARLGIEKAAAKVSQVQDMKATINALCDGLQSVAELHARVQTLFSDNGTNQVVFSSVHKAKGLEAKTVFTIEESFEVRHPKADHKEEANIRYVALTRAKQELVYVMPKPEVAPAEVA